MEKYYVAIHNQHYVCILAIRFFFFGWNIAQHIWNGNSVNISILKKVSAFLKGDYVFDVTHRNIWSRKWWKIK